MRLYSVSSFIYTLYRVLTCQLRHGFDPLIPTTSSSGRTLDISPRCIDHGFLPPVLLSSSDKDARIMDTTGTKHRTSCGWTDLQCRSDVHRGWYGICKDESSQYHEGTGGKQTAHRQTGWGLSETVVASFAITPFDSRSRKPPSLSAGSAHL